MKKMAVIVIITSLVSGCVSVPQQQAGGVNIPLVDMSMVSDQAKYQADVNDCANYARTVDVKGSTVNGLVAGALVGLALGALAGDRKAAHWAGGLGGLSAAGESAKAAENKQQNIMANCLRGRGYAVLG